MKTYFIVVLLLLCIKVKKGNVNHAPQESTDGRSSSSSRPSARRWRTTNVCDAWPVRCQTYGYLPSRKASSPPIGWYQIILLGDRGMCVNLLGVALDSGAAAIRTCNLLIASPASYHYVTYASGGKNSTRNFFESHSHDNLK